MAKRKTEFKLLTSKTSILPNRDSGFVIKIIEDPPVSIRVDFGTHQVYELSSRDLEEFALNILKSLKSKHLK